jgi:hypothetical protein
MMDTGLRWHDAVGSDKTILSSPTTGSRVSRPRYGCYFFDEQVNTPCITCIHYIYVSKGLVWLERHFLVTFSCR